MNNRTITPSQLEAELICALKCDGLLIQHPPFPSYKMALTAVRQNGLALQYIEPSSPIMTEWLCLAAVAQNCKAIHYVPERFKRMLQVWHLALLDNSELLGEIETAGFTEDEYDRLCFRAVLNDRHNVKFVTDPVVKNALEQMLAFAAA